MIISPQATVVVYLNRKQTYHQSVYSRFEILYPEYKMVGYIEDLGVLCCGSDTAYYDMNTYVNDIMSSDFEEMTYADYLCYYKNILVKENPNAPMLNEAPGITFGSSFPQPNQVNEYGQENVTRQVLNANPALTDLNRNGIKVQILKG